MEIIKKLDKFLGIAKSHRDSGFCGGCTYIENNLKNFISETHAEILKDLEVRIKERNPSLECCGNGEKCEYNQAIQKTQALIQEYLKEIC